MELLFPLPPPDPQEQLQQLYDRLAGRFGFGPAVVRLSRRKLTGGEIRYGRPHRITISAHLTPADRDETLRHEAAHAWAHQLHGARVAHGTIFRALAARLGGNGSHAPETPALKEFRQKRRVVTYRCEGCGSLFRRFRPFRGARHCVACWKAGRSSRLRRE